MNAQRVRRLRRWQWVVVGVMTVVIVVGIVSTFAPLEWKHSSGNFGCGVQGAVQWIAWRETPIPCTTSVTAGGANRGLVITCDSFDVWFFGPGRWRVRILTRIGGMCLVAVPVWMPVLLLIGVHVLIWLCLRRKAIGLCAGCGYDLTGNVSGVCPECGEAVRRVGERQAN